MQALETLRFGHKAAAKGHIFLAKLVQNCSKGSKDSRALRSS